MSKKPAAKDKAASGRHGKDSRAGRLLKAGMRVGWARGVQGGNRAWLVVGALSVLGHLARKGLKRPEDVLWTGEVRPGQVLTVRHLPPDA